MTTVIAKTYLAGIIDRIVSNHLRVKAQDGELYEHAVTCVYNAFDAAETYTNRVIVDSIVTFHIDSLDGGLIELPSAPVREVLEVRYFGEDNAWHPLDKGSYTLVANAQRARLFLNDTPALSSARSVGRVEIEAVCGYEDYTERANAPQYALPGDIEQAIMLMAGTFFENSADNITGTIASELPTSAKSLLHPYRIYPYGE